jgi:uncharacterized membrane protein
MSLGSISFRLALICLITLVASLFSANIRVVRFVSIFGIVLLLAVFAFERLTRPPRPGMPQLLHSGVLWVLTLIALLLVYLVLVVADTKLLIFGQLAVLWGVALSALTAYGYFIEGRRADEAGDRRSYRNRGKAFAALAALLAIVWAIITFQG